MHWGLCRMVLTKSNIYKPPSDSCHNAEYDGKWFILLKCFPIYLNYSCHSQQEGSEGRPFTSSLGNRSGKTIHRSWIYMWPGLQLSYHGSSLEVSLNILMLTKAFNSNCFLSLYRQVVKLLEWNHPTPGKNSIIMYLKTRRDWFCKYGPFLIGFELIPRTLKEDKQSVYFHRTVFQLMTSGEVIVS